MIRVEIDELDDLIVRELVMVQSKVPRLQDGVEGCLNNAFVQLFNAQLIRLALRLIKRSHKQTQIEHWKSFLH